MSYIKHVWVTREIIRGANLNHIEDGIYNEERRALSAESNLNTLVNTEESRATRSENALDNRVTATENSITTLNGSASVSGSVNNKIANYTPTFSQASTRANIASGEKFSTIFGKLMKWYADLKAVAFSGSYTDLSNKPTIPTVNDATLTIQKNGTNVQTFTANASANKTANITVPTKTSELTNDSGYITNAGVTGAKGNAESSYRTGNVNITPSNIGLGNVGNFKAVSTVASQGLTDTEKSNARANIGAGTSSFSGSYNDLTNKPTIPTVNNATLTIQKNGTTVKTFTANASSAVTANITVPTKTSEITNDSGFITDAGVTGVKGSSETAYRTGQVNITKANIGLGSVGNFKAVSTAASQGLTATEKANARNNIGVSFSYNASQKKLTISTATIS